MSLFKHEELLQLHELYVQTYDMCVDTPHSKLLTEGRANLLRRAASTDDECIKTACMFMLVYKDNVYAIDAAHDKESGYE